jgi:hypothetical protein
MSRKLIAAALVALFASVPAAWADAVAGSAAFEKGDYVRAMAEWTSAAEHGDPDAEFGLGMLYERGDGELKQDYKQAARWYEKAAMHGNVGAEYRLALISAAGGDGFPADRVEAYKWLLLCAERGLAVEVKAQLRQVLTPAEQEEAEKRAASWKKERAAEKAKAATAALPATTPVGGSALPTPRAGAAATAAGKPGGCPGWPFPTLPCTEQFPALPGATAPRTPAMPPPRPPGPG